MKRLHHVKPLSREVSQSQPLLPRVSKPTPKRTSSDRKIAVSKPAPKKMGSTKTSSKRKTESVISAVSETPATDYNNPEHVRKLLTGFVEIRPENFSKLAPGDRIRYEGIDGNFRPGGFIWYARRSKDGRDFWVIGQSRYPPKGDFSRVVHFALYWDKVLKLWKKTGAEVDLLRLAVDDKYSVIQDIGAFLYYKFGDEFSEFYNERVRMRQENSI
jgi:hypothetical protein